MKADAFLPISGGLQEDDVFDLMCIDSTRPNMTGKDYIQGPLMALTGQNDTLRDENNKYPWETGFDPETARYYEPVTKAYGINNYPSYGVVVDVANHVTPITSFLGMPSWDCGTPLALLLSLIPSAPPPEQVSGEDKSLLEDEDFADALSDLIETMFPTLPQFTETGEKNELAEYKKYTLNFWDAHLSPRYDFDPNDLLGLSFLNQTSNWHINLQDLNHVLQFASTPTTHVLFVRDNAGTPLVQFQDDGNVLLLEGEVSDDNNVNDVSTITRDSNVGEFLIKKGTEIVLKVDASLSGTTRGNVYLKHAIQEDPQISTTSSQEFVIWGYTDWVRIPQIIVNENGYLRVRGHVFMRQQ